MKAFLDTSSVLKLYHQENDSTVVMDIISKTVDEIYLSEIAMLEFRSAFWRKVREKALTMNVAEEAIAFFQNDYGNFRWIALNSAVIESAKNLLMKHGNKGLRTLDSLQLASALALKEEADCIFLTSDTLLKSLMIEEKLNTF